MFFNYFTISSLINALTSLGFCLFVLSRNPRSQLNRSFSFFAFSVGFWAINHFFAFGIQNEILALFFHRALMAGAIFIPTTFFHFVCIFLGIYNEKKSLILLGYIASFVFFLSNFTPLFISGVSKKLFFDFFEDPGPLYHPFLLMFTGFTLYSHYLMFKGFRSAAGAKANQIKYVFTGTLIGFIGGSTNFFPVYNIPIPPLGNCLVTVYIIMVAIAIIRYRLMDIRVVLTRAGIFGVVYFLVLGIPFWVGSITKSWLFSTSLAVLLATSGPFIYNYIRRRTEDVLLRNQRRYQETLRKLSATLTLVKDLERLLKLVVYRVARAIKVEFACVYLTQDHQNLLVLKSSYTDSAVFPALPATIHPDSELASYLREKHKPVFSEELSTEIRRQFSLKSGLLIPSFVRGKLLGFLFLGPKSSGAIYTPEDAAVFEVLANQMALAIENSEFISESQKTQAQLFAAERMTSLGVMAAGLSHQINNRFHAIMMATSDTLDALKFIDPGNINSCPQEIKDYLGQVSHALNRIQENSKHGGKIINDFLNFSQPERLQKETREFDLKDPLSRAIEMVKIKTASADEWIEKEIAADLPLIEGDSVLIQDVFFNLIDNAFDAIKEKEKHINSGVLKPLEPYKGRVRIFMAKTDSAITIQVQDDGIGIREENRKKIFSPFFTTKASSSKGTGLGLFVIQKIIGAHQGEVRVTSRYGEGTTFTITLPIAKGK